MIIRKDHTDDYLHERLSHTIYRLGFSHEVRGIRGDEGEIDFIYLPLSLDAVKRRQTSLDRLLQEVAIISTMPEYAKFSVLIELSSNDGKDLEYMANKMRPIIGNAANIRLDVILRTEGTRHTANNLVITTRLKNR